jgi:hypothetical protein
MEIGNKFEALECTDSGDVTIGNTYEIVGRDGGGFIYFIDDAGDENFACHPGGLLYPDGYRVVE